MSAGGQFLLAANGHFHVRQWAVFHVRRQEVEAVSHALNTRPRKTLDWKTPAEALNEHLLLLQQAGVASTS